MRAVLGFLAIANFLRSIHLTEKEKASEESIVAIVTLPTSYLCYISSRSLKNTNQLQKIHEFAVLSQRETVNSLEENFSVLFSASDNFSPRNINSHF